MIGENEGSGGVGVAEGEERAKLAGNGVHVMRLCVERALIEGERVRELVAFVEEVTESSPCGR